MVHSGAFPQTRDFFAGGRREERIEPGAKIVL
jgi:hypothetical protein